MVGNIRRCRKHVRAIDLSPLPVPPTSFTHLLAGAGCIRDSRLRRRHRERSTPATERSTNSQEREQASEGGWKSGGEAGAGAGVWDAKRGATVGGGYPTRYLNLRLPRGRAQKCKAIVSRPRPVSSSAGSLLCSPSPPSPHPPERGYVSRYTREHRGLGYLSAVRCRCCCLVSSSIYSTRTHDLRNSRRSPMALPLVSLFLFLSCSLIPLYICLLCLSRRSPTIFSFYRRSGSAGVADLRRAKFGRRSFVFARYFR